MLFPVKGYGFTAHEECLNRWEAQFGPIGRGTPAQWAAQCPDIAPGQRGDGRITRKGNA